MCLQIWISVSFINFMSNCPMVFKLPVFCRTSHSSNSLFPSPIHGTRGNLIPASKNAVFHETSMSQSYSYPSLGTNIVQSWSQDLHVSFLVSGTACASPGFRTNMFQSWSRDQHVSVPLQFKIKCEYIWIFPNETQAYIAKAGVKYNCKLVFFLHIYFLYCVIAILYPYLTRHEKRLQISAI